MVYHFSKNDIGFLSFIFHHPLPLFVDDPFEGLTKFQIQKEWQNFCEKFLAAGILSIDNVGNVSLDHCLSEALLCMFGADKMISIIENDVINSVYFLQNEKQVLLKMEDLLFTLEDFKTEQDFTRNFLAKMKIEEAVPSISHKDFCFRLETGNFDELLGWYDKNENDKIRAFSEQNHVSLEKCMAILDAVHLPNCKIVLTERIDEPGTITTKIAYDSGILKLVKIIYTEEKEITILLQCLPDKLTSVIQDFRK